jgi:hypothetical protein
MKLLLKLIAEAFAKTTFLLISYHEYHKVMIFLFTEDNKQDLFREVNDFIFPKKPQLILNLVKRFLKLRICNFDFKNHILQINYEFKVFLFKMPVKQN